MMGTELLNYSNICHYSTKEIVTKFIWFLQDCIKDVQRALHHNYPEKSRHKLYMRLADCYFELGQRQNGIDAMKSAIRQNLKIQLTGKCKGSYNLLVYC